MKVSISERNKLVTVDILIFFLLVWAEIVGACHLLKCENNDLPMWHMSGSDMTPKLNLHLLYIFSMRLNRCGMRIQNCKKKKNFKRKTVLFHILPGNHSKPSPPHIILIFRKIKLGERFIFLRGPILTLECKSNFYLT